MSKELPPLTEKEKYELALQTEQELSGLARTYTLLDRNRAEITQTDGKLSKHKKVIDIYKREQKNILADLMVASAEAKVKQDKKRSRHLADLLILHDELDEQIKREKSYTNEIDYQTHATKKKILDLAAKQVTDEKYQQRILKSEQTVQALENKLEVQTKKFCTISAENKNLHYELRHLLNERKEFNKKWNKLIKNLYIGKKFMLDLIKQATIAYDQREEWVSKLQLLRTKAHNEYLIQTQKMRILQGKRDDDIKMHDFISTKNQKRIMEDIETNFKNQRKKRKEKIEKDLEKYLEILMKIQEYANKQHVPEIAKQFSDQEEENFAKFKYINDLNKEIEQYNDQLTALHTEIDKQKLLYDARAMQQEKALTDLKEKVETQTEIFNKKNTEFENLEQNLATVFNGINSLFKLFRCNNDPLIRLLGHNETINQYNFALYLKIIEKNIQEALVTVHFKEKQAELKENDGEIEPYIVRQDIVPEYIKSIEKLSRPSPCPLCIEHDLVADVIDELQPAYTRDEIKEKLKIRPEISDTLHNVSVCHLPKSKQIMERRYE